MNWSIILWLLISTVYGFTPFYTSDFCSQTITNDCNTTFSYIDNINDEIFPIIQNLVSTSYFRYFKINFENQCKFWNEEHFCATENCAVEILPPNHKPWDEIILNDSLGEKSDIEYCEIDDGHACDSVNLLDNPERFTGYGGKQAHNVWGAIYQENCFLDLEDKECSTKKLFLRIISGMHASISTHLSNEYIEPYGDSDSDDEGQATSPNLRLFMERVGEYNDRISNLYFNYGMVSQAIVKLFKDYPVIDFLQKSEDSFETSDDYEKLFGDLISELDQQPIFQSNLIIDPELKTEFRNKFKNISAIMDCVGCDRCRMWGKLQTIGYGTALKILFEDHLSFRRIELVSLINTFDRLSKSIEAVKNFKLMYLDHLNDVEKGLVQPGQFDKTPDRNGFNFPFMEKSNALKSKIFEKESEKEKNKESEKDQKQEITKSKHSYSDEWKLAYGEVLKALKFVMKSYKTLPVFLFKATLIKLNYWWNTFIGLDTNEYYQDFQLEQNYINLFQN